MGKSPIKVKEIQLPTFYITKTNVDTLAINDLNSSLNNFALKLHLFGKKILQEHHHIHTKRTED